MMCLTSLTRTLPGFTDLELVKDSVRAHKRSWGGKGRCAGFRSVFESIQPECEKTE